MGPPTFGNPIVFVSKWIRPQEHWCYLFRGASEQLKSWKRGRRLKYFASEMKIFCSGDEKSLIGCNQPRWSSQYSEGQIFIIGYRKRILKVQKDWKVTITVVLAGCRNLKYKKQEKVANIFAIPVERSAAALAVHCNRVDLGSVQLKSLDQLHCGTWCCGHYSKSMAGRLSMRHQAGLVEAWWGQMISCLRCFPLS